MEAYSCLERSSWILVQSRGTNLFLTSWCHGSFFSDPAEVQNTHQKADGTIKPKDPTACKCPLPQLPEFHGKGVLPGKSMIKPRALGRRSHDWLTCTFRSFLGDLLEIHHQNGGKCHLMHFSRVNSSHATLAQLFSPALRLYLSQAQSRRRLPAASKLAGA